MSLPTLTLPTYSLKLPSANKTITYRPFIVREEKILLLAVQEGGKNIPDAIKEVLTGCTFGKIDIPTMAQVDLEYLFLNVRNKSMGEGFDIYHKCPTCENENKMSLDLSKIKVEWPTEKTDPVIKLADDMWITMRHPTFDTMFALGESSDVVNASMNAIVECVVGLVHGDTNYDMSQYSKEEVEAFLETFSQEQMKKVKAFFDSAPRVIYEEEYKCPKCDAANVVRLSGTDDFFG